MSVKLIRMEGKARLVFPKIETLGKLFPNMTLGQVARKLGVVK